MHAIEASEVNLPIGAAVPYFTATATLTSRREDRYLKRLRSGEMTAPTVLTGLLLPVVLLGVAQAAALLVVPSFVSNICQLLGHPGLRLLARRLATMLGGVCIGTWLGAGWLTGGPNRWAGAALGLAVLFGWGW